MASAGFPIYVAAGRHGWVCEKPEGSVLVLGPPRSGKTACIMIPNVLAAYGPVVSTSTKQDVFFATVSARRSLGTCWRFDPSGSMPSFEGTVPLRWSPADACSEWDDAVAMADLMVRTARMQSRGDDMSFWNERANTLLAPLLHAAAISGAGMRAVLDSIQRRDPGDALAILESAGAERAVAALSDVEGAHERERSGNYSTLSAVLGAYRLSGALENATDANFDPTSFVDGADTIYICSPSHRQAVVAPIVVGLIKVVQRATIARFAAHELSSWTGGLEGGALEGGALQGGGGKAGGLGQVERRPPVLMALDELANIVPLWDLDSMVADGGSQGLSILACLQDMSQARARWGTAAEGFFTVFGTKVLLAGIGDQRTLQLVSALSGDADARVRSVTRAAPQALGWASLRPRRTSITSSTRRQPVLPVDEVARGRPGMALVIAQMAKPEWAQLTPWYSSEPWRTIASASP
jgi:type IV secretory pathway TraG/TraD family ATPase VirD4